MSIYKLKYFNRISVIFILSILPILSCNITKNIPDGKKLIVKNKIQIENKHFNKKKAGFSEKDIKQIIRPKPNSKVLYTIPLKLIIYNLTNEEKAKKKTERKNEKCIKKKNQKLSILKKRLRNYDQKSENLSSDSKKYKHYARKLSNLQSKIDKINSDVCNKKIWTRRNGEPPVTLNANDKYTNRRRIRIFLKEKGYYNSSIKIEEKPIRHNNKKTQLIAINDIHNDFKKDVAAKRMIVGDVGTRLGYEMEGGEIVVEGNAGNWVGERMKGGAIIVKGNVGSFLGLQMEGGKIVVEGNARYGVGEKMLGGEIFVKGNVGKDAGRDMRGGVIRIMGKVESFGYRGAGKVYYWKDGRWNERDVDYYIYYK